MGKERLFILANAANENLSATAQWVRDKDIVMVGESSHGTLDFYEYRCAITRQLIATGEFMSVCIEADWLAITTTHDTPYTQHTNVAHLGQPLLSSMHL
jgi:erythromycin esterase-like protein